MSMKSLARITTYKNISKQKCYRTLEIFRVFHRQTVLFEFGRNTYVANRLGLGNKKCFFKNIFKNVMLVVSFNNYDTLIT